MNVEMDLHNRWLGGERLPDVRFVMNDYVVVSSGIHAGEAGSVVSVVRFEPNTPYIVEAESGKDIEVRECEIEIASS